MPGKFEAFDASGHRFEVTEAVWRDKVLPSLIKERWNDADALAGVLHLALNEGYFNEALPGAKKLVELEPTSERAALIWRTRIGNWVDPTTRCVRSSDFTPDMNRPPQVLRT